MTIEVFPLKLRAGRQQGPRDIIPLPLSRVSPRKAPAMPAIPLDRLGNDALRALARDIVAEMKRRGRALHNAWDGPRLTEDETIAWLGEETREGMLEKTSRAVGISALPIAKEAEEHAP